MNDTVRQLLAEYLEAVEKCEVWKVYKLRKELRSWVERGVTLTSDSSTK